MVSKSKPSCSLSDFLPFYLLLLQDFDLVLQEGSNSSYVLHVYVLKDKMKQW